MAEDDIAPFVVMAKGFGKDVVEVNVGGSSILAGASIGVNGWVAFSFCFLKYWGNQRIVAYFVFIVKFRRIRVSAFLGCTSIF